jgi:hypothetical protein
MFTPQEILNLFNSKVSILVDSHFIDYIRSNPSQKFTLSVKKQNNGWNVSTTVDIPTQKDIDGFILTLRQFFQNNDPISIRNLAKLYDSTQILDQSKLKIHQLRADFNSWLDSNPNINFTLNNSNITRRDLIWTFLYGLFAHSKEHYVRTINVWRNDLILWNLLRLEFVSALIGVLNYLNEFTIINNISLNM